MREWLLPGLLVAGISLAAVVAAVALSRLNADRDREVRDARLARAELLERQAFEEPLEALALVANGAGVLGPRARTDFAALARPVLDRPEVQTIALVERVPESSRTRFERRSGLRIVDRTPDSEVPSPARPLHYVSTALVSKIDTQPGGDLASTPERLDTLQQAERTGEVTFTPPIRLLSDNSRAVLSIQPAGEGRFVLASLTYARIGASLADQLPDGTAVAITEGEEPIAEVGVPGPGAHETALDIGGRRWTLRTQVEGVGNAPWTALTLAIGLLLAAAVAAFAVVLRRREQDSKAQAGERAAERDAAAAAADRARGFSATLLEAMPDAFAADDRTGLIVVNDALCRLTGYTREELLGRRFPFGLFPEESLVDAGRLRDRLEEHGSAQMELTLRTRAGERFPVNVSAGTVAGVDGPVRISVITDIRDRAAAHAQLEASETRLRELADAATDVVLRLSLSERVEWASPSALNVLGVAPDALVGRRFRELFEDSGAGRLGSDALVGTLRRPDGSQVWIETTITPTHDADGDTSGMRASIRDVTAREEQTRTLSVSEERYRALAGALPDMVVFMTDRDLRFVLAEGGALESAGFQRSDIEGKLVADVLTGEARALLMPHYEAALRGDESTLEHESNVTGRAYATRFIPLRDDDGQIEGVMVVSALRDNARVLV